MLIFIVSGPIIWTSLHDYQKERVLILLDPSKDPRGAGYHTIQSSIAVGSGGISGKGWTEGTQSHLDFPTRNNNRFYFCSNWRRVWFAWLYHYYNFLSYYHW